jgi:choline dehydrogenase
VGAAGARATLADVFAPNPPRRVDTVVIGGGTAGAVVAGRLAEGSTRSVLVLEAGPDYGPLEGGRWPSPLLDARYLPVDDHDWRYVSAARHGQRQLRLERARVVGGCSAHNGCAAVWGHRSDYDGWAALGNPGWGADDLRPHFERARGRMRVRLPERSEIGPFHEAVLAAGPSAGLPRTDDLDDLDGGVGMCLSPLNVVRRGDEVLRWNTAFAYLDPVRGRAGLTVVGDVTVERIALDGARAVGVEARVGGAALRIECGEIVLAGGAYGSPALLLRSGIGPPAHLETVGVDVRHRLPGVGGNLHDHPAFSLTYAGTDRLVRSLGAFGQPLREEGAIAKARSTHCREGFDLHLYPFGSPYWNRNGTWMFAVPAACMTPRSRGTVRLASADPAEAPIIDHGYLTDPDDRDLAVLLDGVDLARALASQAPLAELLGPESSPGPELMDREQLRGWIRRHGVHYYHPVGTCKMGPAEDPEAVVDARGRVHGLAGLRVADASVMPVVPRANTNLPCVVVGEKIARLMLDDG